MVILRDSALDYDSAVMVREFVIISPAMKRTLNTTINRSKSEKNDEHYNQLADIEYEVRHYRDQFRGIGDKGYPPRNLLVSPR